MLPALLPRIVMRIAFLLACLLVALPEFFAACVGTPSATWSVAFASALDMRLVSDAAAYIGARNVACRIVHIGA